MGAESERAAARKTARSRARLRKQLKTEALAAIAAATKRLGHYHDQGLTKRDIVKVYCDVLIGTVL